MTEIEIKLIAWGGMAIFVLVFLLFFVFNFCSQKPGTKIKQWVDKLHGDD